MSSVSALGSESEEIWNSYQQGKPVFSKVKTAAGKVYVSKVSEAVAQDIAAIDASNSNYKRLDRSVILAMLAARKSVSALIEFDGRWGINLGSSRGATELFEDYFLDFHLTKKAKTLASPTTTLGNISTWVAQDLHINGMTLAHSVTCATAMHAVLNGIAWLKGDMVDAMLVGGAEAPLTPFTIAQMEALKLYSNEQGEFPCRALDLEKTSNTMVLGEAAATAVLVKGKHPKAQALISGYGWGSEPLDHHTSLSKNALCFQQSMKQALESAEVETVDAIVMHAPGTVLGDKAEMEAIRTIFGNKIPFLATNKTLVGHTLGASGMLSMELGVYFLMHNSLISNPFYKQTSLKTKPVQTVLVNAVGFGGNAVSLVLTKA